MPSGNQRGWGGRSGMGAREREREMGGERGGERERRRERDKIR